MLAPESVQVLVFALVTVIVPVFCDMAAVISLPLLVPPKIKVLAVLLKTLAPAIEMEAVVGLIVQLPELPEEIVNKPVVILGLPPETFGPAIIFIVRPRPPKLTVPMVWLIPAPGVFTSEAIIQLELALLLEVTGYAVSEPSV